MLVLEKNIEAACACVATKQSLPPEIAPQSTYQPAIIPLLRRESVSGILDTFAAYFPLLLRQDGCDLAERFKAVVDQISVCQQQCLVRNAHQQGGHALRRQLKVTIS